VNKVNTVRWILPAVGALAALALAFGGSRRCARASSAAIGSADVASAGVGRQRRWAVTLEMGLEQADGGSATQAAATVVTGDWVVTVIRSSADGYDVACELDRPHLSGGAVNDAAPADMISFEERLSRRFWMTYQPDGAATRAHFPRDMSDDVRNLLLAIVTESELVRPVRPSPQWTSTERDGVGSYFADYQDLGSGSILKRKMRYLSVDGSPDPTDTSFLRVATSEARYAVDRQGLVDEVRVDDTTRFDPKLGAPITIAIHLHLDHPRSADAPELIGSLERARSTVVSGPVATQRPTEEEALSRSDQHLLKNVALRDLLAAIRDGHADDALRGQLEADLRQRSSDISAAVAFARESSADAAAIVLHALAAAGTPAAQDALGKLALDPGAQPSLRSAAVGSFMQTRRPTPETASTLLQLLADPQANPDVARYALYAAGVVARNVQETHPEQFARIEAALVDRYAKCQGAGCVESMEALGNLATPGVVPSIERALRDPSVGLRSAAARALRLVKDPDADRLLAATIGGDADANVRDAAVFATKFRPAGSLIEALCRAVEADPAELVRVDAIKALAGHIDESPLVGQTLVKAATKDSMPGVRRAARGALGPRVASGHQG
jgi:HEAT repeat protein